jgi:hypothetical protein
VGDGVLVGNDSSRQELEAIFLYLALSQAFTRLEASDIRSCTDAFRIP